MSDYYLKTSTFFGKFVNHVVIKLHSINELIVGIVNDIDILTRKVNLKVSALRSLLEISLKSRTTLQVGRTPVVHIIRKLGVAYN